MFSGILQVLIAILLNPVKVQLFLFVIILLAYIPKMLSGISPPYFFPLDVNIPVKQWV